MFLAGPGWVIFGAIKQVVGLFLAVYLIANVADGAGIANQPVHQFLEIYQNFMPRLAGHDAGRRRWSSSARSRSTSPTPTRVRWRGRTRSPASPSAIPGRLVFLGVNLLIALVLMEANMFDFLNTILGFYANCGMAWVVVVASDIVVQQVPAEALAEAAGVPPRHAVRDQPGRLRLDARSPRAFRSLRSSAALGEAIRPYSPLVAIGLALVLPPIFAIATKGKYYLRRTDDGIDLPMYDELRQPVRRAPELPRLPSRLRAAGHDRRATTHDAFVCSLCLSTDKVADHVLPAQIALRRGP